MVGVGDKDVKWNTKDEVVTKIMDTANYLRITVVTPIKASQKCKSSESESSSLMGSSSITSSSNVINLFAPSSYRTSFSSISSTTSDTTSSSGSEKLENRRKKSWSFLKIIDDK